MQQECDSLHTPCIGLIEMIPLIVAFDRVGLALHCDKCIDSMYISSNDHLAVFKALLNVLSGRLVPVMSS